MCSLCMRLFEDGSKSCAETQYDQTACCPISLYILCRYRQESLISLTISGRTKQYLSVMGIGQDQERARALAAEFEIPLTDEGNKPALRLEVSSHEVRLAGYLPRGGREKCLSHTQRLVPNQCIPGMGQTWGRSLVSGHIGEEEGARQGGL